VNLEIPTMQQDLYRHPVRTCDSNQIANFLTLFWSHFKFTTDFDPTLNSHKMVAIDTSHTTQIPLQSTEHNFRQYGDDIE